MTETYLTFKDYQFVLSNLPQKYRDESLLIKTPTERLMYCLGKFSVEANEALEKFLHHLRDDGYEDEDLFPVEAIMEEIGDALRYAAEACTVMGESLEAVAEDNMNKVARKADTH